jgi:hypothetical protein
VAQSKETAGPIQVLDIDAEKLGFSFFLGVYLSSHEGRHGRGRVDSCHHLVIYYDKKAQYSCQNVLKCMFSI